MSYEPDVSKFFETFRSENKEFTLTINVYSGGASLSMFRADQRGAPALSAKLRNLASLYTHSRVVREIIAGPPEKTIKVFDNDAETNGNDGGSRKPVTKTYFTYGKDGTGMIYIEVGTPQQPAVRFTLKSNGYGAVQESTAENEAEVKAKMSKDQAMAYADSLYNVPLAKALSRDKKNLPPNQGGGNRGGNFGNNRNYQNNGGQKSSSYAGNNAPSVDDAIPF